MSYHLDFSNQAYNDIAFHKKAGNKALLKKLFVLFNELSEHPFIGAGKPEQLKHELTGLWSRRISSEPRLVYEVKEDSVLVHSAKGQYS